MILLLLAAADSGDSIDIPNLTGLGVGAVLLALVFRTLWKQEGGWRSVLTASRDDAREARSDAAAARADAAAARSDARAARSAEKECQIRLGRMQQQVDALTEKQANTSRRLDSLDSGEHPTTD